MTKMAIIKRFKQEARCSEKNSISCISFKVMD